MQFHEVDRMIENGEIYQIHQGVTLRRYADPRFKTMKLSVHLLLPLRRGTAAAYGILPGLVTRATREYPDFTALSRRLSELYGASLAAGVLKMGGFQCLSLSASGLSGKYAFGGDDMLAELSGLLFSALFDPLLDEDGLFPAENFDQERRQLLELKDAEFNDKIAYAHQRCEELVFKGEDAAEDRYGSREAIEALDRRDLSAAWREALSNARVEIFALGDCQPDPAAFRDRFAGVGRPQPLAPLPFQAPGEPRRQTEEQPVVQSKLSMGFRVDAPDEDHLLFQLMSAALGGVPSSKLFQNVREKMSLCYYCSSHYSSLRRALYIESGVETRNLDRAEREILRQLEALRAGELTEEELLSAKLALRNSFLSVRDSLNAVQTWYLGQAFLPKGETPEEAAQRVLSYTREQVVEAARKIDLAAVYRLRGQEEV